MSKPTILAVDDDRLVLAAITRDLNSAYGEDYRVVPTSSGAEALSLLARIALRDEPVALIAADQRMPKMTGIELLQQAQTHAPTAKLVLLTAYADTDVAIRAINDIGLDYYLMKPWDPPAERLYPILDELLLDWQQAHPDHSSEVRVVGHRWSDRSYDLKMFLARNHVPYRWYDIERDAEAQRLTDLARAATTDLPLVLVPGGETLRAPRILDVAGALGLHTSAQQPLYDVCIVGGGPAGLAAAVYAASEGLSTVVVEREAPGGQAGQSAAIENYLGFPKGLSGSDLAQRAIAQVSRFGAEMVLARDVTGLEARGPVRAVLFDGAGEIEARTVIAATGVSYRRLPAAGVDGAQRARGLLRRERQRGEPVRRGRRLHRRRRKLRRPGRAEYGSARPPGRPGRPGRDALRHHVAVPGRPDHRHTQHRGALPQRGGGRPGGRASGADHPRRSTDRRHRRPARELAVHLHRRLTAHRMARA